MFVIFQLFLNIDTEGRTYHRRDSDFSRPPSYVRGTLHEKWWLLAESLQDYFEGKFFDSWALCTSSFELVLLLTAEKSTNFPEFLLQFFR